jgi:hypothetical protein
VALGIGPDVAFAVLYLLAGIVTTRAANWRVTFSFEGEDAAEVDYLDYH